MKIDSHTASYNTAYDYFLSFATSNWNEYFSTSHNDNKNDVSHRCYVMRSIKKLSYMIPYKKKHQRKHEKNAEWERSKWDKDKKESTF